MNDDLLDEAQRLIAELESHPDATVGERATRLLQAIDAVHRTGLTRLVGAIRSMAGDAFVHRLAADPAIRLLLMSYELLAVDRRLLADEALDAVRGHLHARRIDVELLDVVGGAVYVRLHGLERSAIPQDAVRRDVEEALAAGLVGFQELVIGDRRAAPPALLQIGGLGAVRQPVYRPVCRLSEIPPGGLLAVGVEGESILIANVDGELHALANRCGDTPLPLQFGTLAGAELRCSWHGCRYDVRTGRRIGQDVGHVAVFPVSLDRDEIRVAVGVEHVESA